LAASGEDEYEGAARLALELHSLPQAHKPGVLAEVASQLLHAGRTGASNVEPNWYAKVSVALQAVDEGVRYARNLERFKQQSWAGNWLDLLNPLYKYFPIEPKCCFSICGLSSLLLDSATDASADEPAVSHFLNDGFDKLVRLCLDTFHSDADLARSWNSLNEAWEHIDGLLIAQGAFGVAFAFALLDTATGIHMRT
jgi:hypothetical protein